LIANNIENLSFQIECKFVFTKLKIPLKIFTTATISSLVKKGKHKTVPQEVNSQINYHNVKQTELKNNLKQKNVENSNLTNTGLIHKYLQKLTTL